MNRAILASPKKHAAVLLWEYEESEYEEAGAVLPDGLKEAVILQFEQEQAAAPEEPGSSEESADSAPDARRVGREEKWPCVSLDSVGNLRQQGQYGDVSEGERERGSRFLPHW